MMYEAMSVVSVTTVCVLIYLIVMNFQLSCESKTSDRSKVLMYLQLLHFTSLIFTVSYLLNHFEVASNKEECAILNYITFAARDLQLLWTVFAWEIQVRIMTRALWGPSCEMSIWRRCFWIVLPKTMIVTPIFALVMNLSTWWSSYDTSLEPPCAMLLLMSETWVLNTRMILSIAVHGLFFFQFLIQTRVASKMVTHLVADLKRFPINEGRSIDCLQSDAMVMKQKAQSASRRNLLIGANATVWAVLTCAVIPHLEDDMSAFDIYLVRVALVLSALTVNCAFYLIFAEWRVYICFLGRREKLVGTIKGVSALPLLADQPSKTKRFYKSVGDDDEVEYFAAPALIYKSNRNKG